MEIKHWLLVGDQHGNFVNFKNLPKEYRGLNTAVIILGDAGYNYYLDGRDKKSKKRFVNNVFGGYVYCVRGNHEARPSNLMGAAVEVYKNDGMTKSYISSTGWIFEYDPNVKGRVYYEKEFPTIRYFLDEGGFYTIQDKRVLVVPGAYSVDKDYRLQNGWTWFPDEQLSAEEMGELLYSAEDVDYILSHTAPISYEPYYSDLFLGFIDQSSVDKTTEYFLEELINTGTNPINYKILYFGHFHDDRNVGDKGVMLNNRFIKLGDKIRYDTVVA